MIERFIEELCSRPAIAAAQVEAIEHGLYTAWCDADPALWDKLHPVITGRDRNIVERLLDIQRITNSHLGKAA